MRKKQPYIQRGNRPAESQLRRLSLQQEKSGGCFQSVHLINSLALSEIGNYWVMSGATSMLPKFVNDMELKLREFENCYVDKVMLESSDVTDGGAELFLYQSGYLTIKDSYEGGYILTIPNHEVRMALYMVVIPALTMNSLSTVAIQGRRQTSRRPCHRT